MRRKRILVTGASGFIGTNLVVRLGECPDVEVLPFKRGDGPNRLEELVARADTVVHLAGANRPANADHFAQDNMELTRRLCECLDGTGRRIPLILASSTQAEADNPYGRSKLAAEQIVGAFAQSGNPAVIYRLPGVFGKWCKPNYNSVVATFCHNVARGLPIEVRDPAFVLRLVYIDDVVDEMLRAMMKTTEGLTWGTVAPAYTITLEALAEQVRAFRHSRTTLEVGPVGNGLLRALYATYVSYLPPESFAYELPVHGDARGRFVEMLKTRDSGQFSFFTIRPGVTRGAHYHHSKTEKFLLVKGAARMRFRHLITGEIYEAPMSGDAPRVIDTIPGWTHEITNTGEEEAIVMLWASELFDRERPDTIPCRV